MQVVVNIDDLVDPDVILTESCDSTDITIISFNDVWSFSFPPQIWEQLIDQYNNIDDEDAAEDGYSASKWEQLTLD